jgi:hypothetical protein
LFGPEMLAATHDAEVGAGVSFTVVGAAVDGATVGAAVDGATVGAAVDGAVVGAAVDGATVGAAVVDSTHATSQFSPSNPALQTQVSPSQTPFPLQAVACLLAGEALFGPEIFVEHEEDARFHLLPGVALLGPLMFVEHCC